MLRSTGNDNLRTRPEVPTEIWSLLDEIMGGAPARGNSRHPRTFCSQMRLLLDDDDGLLWYGDLLESRLGEMLSNRLVDLEERRVEPVDAKAVLSKCRREQYKPKAERGSKGQAESDQSECPVCLEKFVVDDPLLSLPCNHKFHTDCLVPWIKSNHGKCPCCRADILSGPKPVPSGLSSLRVGRSGNTNRGSSSSSSSSIINPTTPIRDWGITSGRTSGSSSSLFSIFRGGDGFRGHEDILTVLSEMETLLERFGFRD